MKLLYIFSSVFFKDTLHYVLPSYTHPTAGSAVPCPYSSTLQLGLEIVCRLLGCLAHCLCTLSQQKAISWAPIVICKYEPSRRRGQSPLPPRHLEDPRHWGGRSSRHRHCLLQHRPRRCHGCICYHFSGRDSLAEDCLHPQQPQPAVEREVLSTSVSQSKFSQGKEDFGYGYGYSFHSLH